MRPMFKLRLTSITATAAQPVGTVVMAAASAGAGSALLFEAPIDRLESGSLHLQSTGGPRLSGASATVCAVRSDRVSE